MRGCLLRAKDPKTGELRDRKGLPKGAHTWRIILALGRGANGKHKQKWHTFHGTKTQAEARLNQLTGEVHRGEYIEPSKTTLGEFLDHWVEMAIKPPQRCQNTYESYKAIIRLHIKPALGHLPLQAVTPLHIERYYADLKVSPASACVHHAVLSHALKSAVNSGHVRSNAASRVSNKPRLKHGEDVLHNVWTVEEARRFLATVKQEGSAQYAALFALALDGGLRKGELLGLKWDDLDLASRTLRVERQLLGRDEKKNLVTSLPKSGRARSLDLSEETVTLLREHKKQQAEIKLKNRLQFIDYGLVFSQAWEQMRSRNSDLGGPMCRTAVCSQLERFRVMAGVKKITVHGLRHTCATLLLSAGVPPHVVQRRLGHKNIAITLDIYGHVLPSMQQDAAQRLATLLHG